MMDLAVLCHFCGDQITKLNGHDSDSLLMHHITYIPELKVPSHRGCSVRYHNTHPDHPTNPETEYRKRFIERLGGNIICHFCGEEITEKYGMKSESLLIHSLDDDHDNWDQDNKVPTHRGCHMRYHMNNMSDESRQKISDALTGVPKSEEHRQSLSNAMKGESAIESNRKGWITRHKRYGPLGFKEENPMKRPEIAAKVSKKLTGRKHGSERNKKAWKKRRELYGPSGGDFSKGWELRREKYGASGHSKEAYGKKVM